MTVRFFDELNDLEKLSVVPISYSRLNTYDMCNAMYWYQYIAKEEEPFATHATLGNIIHSVLEEEVQPDEPISDKDFTVLIDQYTKQREIWDPEEQIPGDLIDAGVEMISEFIDRHDGDVFRVIDKEHPFEVVVGRAYIRGFIDRVDLDDNGKRITITDYKTGKNEVSFANAKNDLQLGIYALAMQHEHPDKEIYAQLYYLRTGRQKGHLFTRDDLDAVESRVVEAVDGVIYQQDFNPTDNRRICSFCSWAKTGACPTGSKINRYQGR